MKIISVSKNDWANLSFNMTKAMRSVGLDAECYALNPHVFGYDFQAQITTLDRMRSLVLDADIINICHSDIFLFNALEKELKGKRVIVTHTGSAYRNNPKAYNDIFNKQVYLTLTDHCEFIKLGAKNINYITYSVDKTTEPVFSGAKIIGHYPSNTEVKGTSEIIDMLKECVPHKLLYSCEKVSHGAQIKRMAQCGIYIELFKPELNGRPYGHFGVTAFEAALAGKIVITQNLNLDEYEKAYGTCPFYICNTKNKFIETVNGLLAGTDTMIELLQKQTHYDICKNHSLKANGERLKNLIA